jgi:hypothetical protein
MIYIDASTFHLLPAPTGVRTTAGKSREGTMDTITCETCSGSGRVTVTRSRWVGGSIEGYRSTITGAVRCNDCAGSGTVPAVACDACGAMVPEIDAMVTIDGEGYVCETCFEAEQAAILEANPELTYLTPWLAASDGPEVA